MLTVSKQFSILAGRYLNVAKMLKGSNAEGKPKLSMKAAFSLAGQTALVTGSTSGLGLEVAGVGKTWGCLCMLVVH